MTPSWREQALLVGSALQSDLAPQPIDLAHLAQLLEGYQHLLIKGSLRPMLPTLRELWLQDEQDGADMESSLTPASQVLQETMEPPEWRVRFECEEVLSDTPEDTWLDRCLPSWTPEPEWEHLPPHWNNPYLGVSQLML